MSPYDLALLLTQIAVMLAVGQLCGRLMRKLGQPAVLGELVGGILLGPTVFGSLFPSVYSWLFPSTGIVALTREALITFGMLFFLFAAGLEVNLKIAGRLRWPIGWTSVLGIALPFALGFCLVIASPSLWGTQAETHVLAFALFVGAALSLSALPVIARILMDLNLLEQELGTVVMSAATINDLIGWTLFAVVLSYFVPDGVYSRGIWATLALTAGFFALILVLGRWTIQQVNGWMRNHPSQRGMVVEAALIPVLLAAAAAEAIGIHAFLGAFLVGIAAAEDLPQRDSSYRNIHQFAVSFFAPIYFVSVGLRADFVTQFDLLLVSAVFLTATVGKICGAGFGARIGGMPARESLAVGFAMNARGAIEIILASVALQHRLIDQRVFVALVIMAIATSMLSGPVIQRLLPAKVSGS
jgi:Kef-type K+ transport system membrane component KefB